MSSKEVTPLVQRPDDTLPIFQNFGVRLEYYSSRMESLLQHYREAMRQPKYNRPLVLMTDGDTVGKVGK